MLPTTGSTSSALVIVAAALVFGGSIAFVVGRHWKRGGAALLAVAVMACGVVATGPVSDRAEAATPCVPTTTGASAPTSVGPSASSSVPPASTPFEPTTTVAAVVPTAPTTTTTPAVATGPDYYISVAGNLSDRPSDMTVTSWTVTITEVAGRDGTGPLEFSFTLPDEMNSDVAAPAGSDWTRLSHFSGAWLFTSTRVIGANETVVATFELSTQPGAGPVTLALSITTGSAGDTDTANNSASATVAVPNPMPAA